MLVFETQQALKAYLNSELPQNASIGLVPTMGALHQGHLSLLEQSLQENDYTIMSIFVNPTQFNNAEDLQKYPRTLDEDVKKVSGLSPDIIIFAPSVEDIYNGNTVSQNFDFDGLELQMEGKHRPGHFDGVGTIVKKLFDIIRPSNAYFGEKDFQQLQIIKKMVEKEHLSVNVIGRPIFREANGLAMSSRNTRLSSEEKESAAKIYQTLLIVKKMFETTGIKEIENWVISNFENDPVMKIEYFEIANENTLIKAETKTEGQKYRAFIVVYVNDVRLIDTISLN